MLRKKFKTLWSRFTNHIYTDLSIKWIVAVLKQEEKNGKPVAYFSSIV